MTIEKIEVSTEEIAILSFSFLSLVLLPFFPIASYFVSIAILLFYGDTSYTKNYRFGLVLIAIFSLLTIYVSRDFRSELAHDLSVYYTEYIKIVEQNWDSYYLFSDGWEPGYHVLYSAVAWVFPTLSEIGLALVNVIITFALLLVWLRINITRDGLPASDAGLIYALVIVFAGFVTFGYFQRQSLSFVVLLFALSAKSRLSFIFFAVLSASFHLTSIPILLLYSVIRNIHLSRRMILAVLPLAVFLVLFFRFVFYTLASVLLEMVPDFPGVYKLNYYRIQDFSILSTKDVLLNLALFLLLLLRWDYVHPNWRNIILVSLIVYFSFLGIPLLAERLSFILFLLYGFFVYLVCFERSRLRPYLKFFVLFYVCLFCLKSISSAGVEGADYWVRYRYVDHHPFYYLLTH